MSGSQFDELVYDDIKKMLEDLQADITADHSNKISALYAAGAKKLGRLVKKDDPAACFVFGERIMREADDEELFEKGLFLITRAANNGLLEAQIYLGVRFLHQAAEQGHPVGQALMAAFAEYEENGGQLSFEARPTRKFPKGPICPPRPWSFLPKSK